MERLAHISPEYVIDRAMVVESIQLNEGQAFCVRDFDNNFNEETVSGQITNLTGYSSERIHQIVEDSLRVVKKGNVFTGYGGDSLILDPELKQDRGGDVEFMIVNKCNLDDFFGETALVRMWKYGALKQLLLPENNPGKQLCWEMMMSLKDKLTIVLPREVENVGGLLVAKDNGVKVELNPGDAIFLPLVPRQVISNNKGTFAGGTKFFELAPAWGGETGVSQKPVYWREQVGK